MKHFITGGSGFAGLHVIDRLLKAGEEVVVYDLAPLDEEYRKKGVRYIHGDIRDKANLEEAMRGCNAVHHNAAVLPISRAGKEFWDINVDGTKNVLEAALKSNVKKVLVISTSAVYGVPKELPVRESTKLTPLGEYAKSKAAADNVAEEFRKNHDIDVSIVRPRTIVGTGRLGIFGILFDWISAGKRIYTIGKGDNLYQLLSVKDYAEACYLMTTKRCKNEDFLLGAKEFGTVRESMEGLIRHAGTASRVQPINATFVRAILEILDFLRLAPFVDYHYKTPHKPLYFDTTKAETMLGWRQQDSNVKMLSDTYDWFVANRERLEQQKAGTTHRKLVKQGILKLVRALS